MRYRIGYLITLIVALTLVPVRADVVRTTPRANGATRVIYQTSVATATTLTTEETLYTYTLPANTLNSNGVGIEIECWGTTAANANSKSLNLYWGATQINGKTGGVNNGQFHLISRVLRVTSALVATTGESYQYTNGASAAVAGWFTAPTDDLTANVVITCKGLTGTAAGDLTARGMFVRLIPLS